MIQHILVPLDGSRLSEASLPVASTLAGILKAKVTLIHIIEKSPPVQIHGEPHLASPAEAEAYLKQVAGSFFPGFAGITWHVHADEVKNVPRALARHEGETGHDLVVMCTHGRGGAASLLLGSVAQKVIAGGTVPVLMVRPQAGTFTLGTVLVPLDGDPEHEEGLTLAEEIARACGAALRLLLVVPTLGTFTGKGSETVTLLPSATRVMLDISVEGAGRYLEEKKARLRDTGLKVTASVVRGDPSRRIVSAARTMKAGLIVLATHGKSGMDAIFSGSVANKVCGRCRAPILFVPAGKSLTPSSRS